MYRSIVNFLLHSLLYLLVSWASLSLCLYIYASICQLLLAVIAFSVRSKSRLHFTTDNSICPASVPMAPPLSRTWRSPWPGWPTIVLQCCDIVGWVIWPVKSSPKWPVMLQMGRQTVLYYCMVNRVCLPQLRLSLVLDVGLGYVLYSLITTQSFHKLTNFVKCPSSYFLTICHLLYRVSQKKPDCFEFR